MRVLVTGGRDYDNRPQLYRQLDAIHADELITCIVNGGMTGADALSSRWAYDRKVDTECYGAKWGQYGGRAGPIRNAAMLASKVDLVVAFPGGRGTAHTVELAKRKGVATVEVPK